MIQRLLALRRTSPRLFAEGEYRAVPTEGEFSDCIVCFERRLGAEALLVAVPRNNAKVAPSPIGVAWGDSAVSGPSARRWRDIFTGRNHEGEMLKLSEVFADFPSAVLLGES